MGKLTTKGINSIKITGKNFDGGGLYLLVNARGSKLWRGKYRFEGKEKTASYGAYPEITLKEAREKHAAFRAKLSQGVDPQAEKKQAKADKEANQKARFDVLALDWFTHTAKTKQWSARHRQKVETQLKRHIIPTFGKRDSRDIRPKEITDLIQQINDRGINRTARLLKPH